MYGCMSHPRDLDALITPNMCALAAPNSDRGSVEARGVAERDARLSIENRSK